MCICAGVCETVAVVAVGGYIVRKWRKRPAQRPVCPKCGAPQARLMYNSTLCFDCYYGTLSLMKRERSDAAPDR